MRSQLLAGIDKEPAGTVPAGEAAEQGGESEDESGPVRRCIVTGRRGPPETMIRFVVGPGNQMVPDVDGRLPGRGIWLSAGRDMVNTAVAKNLFSKAARARVSAPPDLAETVERLLARRCLDTLGFARRAGQAVMGFEKVRAMLKAGEGAVLLAASDGAEGGREKIRALASDLPLITLFGRAELGAAFGRDEAVHVAVASGRLAERLREEASRLAGFRSGGVER